MRRYRFQYYLCNWLRWGNFSIKKLFKLGYPEFFFTNKTSTRISDIKFQRCQHQGIERYLFAYKRLRFAKNSFHFYYTRFLIVKLFHFFANYSKSIFNSKWYNSPDFDIFMIRTNTYRRNFVEVEKEILTYGENSKIL